MSWCSTAVPAAYEWLQQIDLTNSCRGVGPTLSAYGDANLQGTVAVLPLTN